MFSQKLGRVATMQKTHHRVICSKRPGLAHIARPIEWKNQYSSRRVLCKYNIHDLEYASYYVGKSVVLFTMFYCTLNWWHYKQMNDEQEKDEKNE
jgi:hypothetical protein